MLALILTRFITVQAVTKVPHFLHRYSPLLLLPLQTQWRIYRVAPKSDDIISHSAHIDSFFMDGAWSLDVSCGETFLYEKEFCAWLEVLAALLMQRCDAVSNQRSVNNYASTSELYLCVLCLLFHYIYLRYFLCLQQSFNHYRQSYS